jgi:hypothetical protein
VGGSSPVTILRNLSNTVPDASPTTPNTPHRPSLRQTLPCNDKAV